MNIKAKKAAEVLKKGGIVIFPTDTAYGIGCRIDDEKAVQRLFKLRKRPETKATPVLVSSLEMAKKYWYEIPDIVYERLIKPYWPGALTIVLPCKKELIPGLVRGGGETLGLRMPDNENLLTIIEEVGVPIIGTSANFAGESTPFKFESLDPELVKLVDFVLDGECKTKNSSAVIDCVATPWKILRQGALKIDLSI
jgi:L-threonylcarbamoyladenylate synthase